MDKSVDNVDKQPSPREFQPTEPVLAIFAKQPVAGQVKTRLCPPLSEVEAARLCQVALAETVQRLWDCPLRKVLCYAGDYNWFVRAFPEVLLMAQVDGDLGERLQAAAERLFAAGGGPVLFIGADSPDLPEALVMEALSALQQADVVTVPSVDGGYALIGLKRPCPEVFTAIPWSTARVLSATRERAARCGLAYRELAEWDDLDDLASLQRLVERSPWAGTARYVQWHLARYLDP